MSLLPLSDQELKTIDEASMKILAETGVQFNYPPALKTLQKKGAKVEEDLVFFPPEMVKEYLREVPSSFLLQAINPERDVELGAGVPVTGPPSGALNIAQKQGEPRPARGEDYLRLAKLVQTSPVIDLNGTGIVIPAEMDEREYNFFAFYNLLGISDKPFMTACRGTENVRHSLTMMEIVSRRANLLGIANVNTPLIYDQSALEGIIEFCRAGQPLLIASCGMAGSTSPISLQGTVALTNAEILAGLVYAQALNPGQPVIYGNTSTVTNMKDMNLSLGAPETALINAASGQLADYYGLPFRSGGGLSDAGSLDIKAGYEAMMNLMVSYLTGFDLIMHDGGILDSFMTVSYEKLMVDEEIISIIKKYLKGMDRDGLKPSMNEIMERCPGGHFLDSDTTLQGFKTEFKSPLFSGDNLFQQAKDEWQRRLDDYHPPELEQRVKGELESYCREELDDQFSILEE